MDARFSYREAAAQGASPVRLVICLYEQAIEDLRRALGALKKDAVEMRTLYINHAIMVIAHLQSTLDMKQGGKVASNLAKFYSTVRAGVTEAHGRQSIAMLEEQICYLVEVHEAWLQVERETNHANSSTIISPSTVAIPQTDSPLPTDWSA